MLVLQSATMQNESNLGGGRWWGGRGKGEAKKQNLTLSYSGSLRWNSSMVWLSLPAADLCRAV